MVVGRLLLAVMSVLAVALAVPGHGSAQTGGVLVVGDSLEVGTGPHLRRELASAALTIDARRGRPSSEGVGVVRERLRPGHEVVVFDLGVNDDPSEPQPLARNLEEVRTLVGDRCLVVATLSRRPLDGVSIDGMNRVIRKFVADTPRAHLFDWRDATQSDPRLLGRDRLHPTPAGYLARARLLARAITDCLDPDAPEPDAPDAPDAPEPASPPEEEEPAESAAAPARGGRADPPWLDWVLTLRDGPVATYVRNGIERVEEAARDAVGALSPPRPEPTLGTAPGSTKSPPKPRQPPR